MANIPSHDRNRERLAGLMLMAAAGLALVAANSGFAHGSETMLEYKVGPAMPHLGPMSIH